MANLIPISFDSFLGYSSTANVESQLGGVSTDPSINSRITNIGKRLSAKTENRSLPYQFKALNTNKINAFALPGGPTYVTVGLLNGLNPTDDELAAVMGHELGHINNRHGVKAMELALGAGFVTDLVKSQLKKSEGLGLDANDVNRIDKYNKAVAGFVSMGYSRDNEYEADAAGLNYMTAAGYNPYAMVSLMTKLQALEGRKTTNLEEFFSTHPATTKRIDEINGIIASTYPAAKPLVAPLPTGAQAPPSQPPQTTTISSLKPLMWPAIGLGAVLVSYGVYRIFKGNAERRVRSAELVRRNPQVIPEPLPKFIHSSLVGTKPSAQLSHFKMDDNIIIRYKGIKSGGIQYEARGKTFDEAAIKMWAIIKKHNLLMPSQSVIQRNPAIVKKEQYSERRGETGVFHDVYRVRDSVTGENLGGADFSSQAIARETADKINARRNPQVQLRKAQALVAKAYARDLATKSPQYLQDLLRDLSDAHSQALREGVDTGKSSIYQQGWAVQNLSDAINHVAKIKADVFAIARRNPPKLKPVDWLPKRWRVGGTGVEDRYSGREFDIIGWSDTVSGQKTLGGYYRIKFIDTGEMLWEHGQSLRKHAQPVSLTNPVHKPLHAETQTLMTQWSRDLPDYFRPATVNKIMKYADIIADYEKSDIIMPNHLAEAVQFARGMNPNITRMNSLFRKSASREAIILLPIYARVRELKLPIKLDPNLPAYLQKILDFYPILSDEAFYTLRQDYIWDDLFPNRYELSSRDLAVILEILRRAKNYMHRRDGRMIEAADILNVFEALQKTKKLVKNNPVPSFSSTEDAEAYGRSIAGQPDKIRQLKLMLQHNIGGDIQEMKDMADPDYEAWSKLVAQGQFYREALEAAQVKTNPPADPISDYTSYLISTGLPELQTKVFVGSIIKAIEDKNISLLRSWMNGINPKLNRLFEHLTGLPAKTQSDVDKSLEIFNPAGWAQMKKDNAEKFARDKAEAAESQRQSLIRKAKSTRYRTADGVMTFEETLKKHISQGFNKIVSYKRGATIRYVLQNDKGVGISLIGLGERLYAEELLGIKPNPGLANKLLAAALIPGVPPL